MIIGVTIGTMVRYVRIISEIRDMIHATVQYLTELREAGHSKEKLAIALVKFCGNYSNYLWKYGIYTRKDCIKNLIDPILTKI